MRAPTAALLLSGLTAACGAGPEGPPGELIPWVRLSASATRLRQGLLWPREAEDGVGAVRDDRSESAYRLPVGQETTIEIDLLPALEQPVPLLALSARWALGLPAEARLELATACGQPADTILAWDEPDAALELGGRRAGCLRLVLRAAAEVDIAELSLVGRALPGRLRDPDEPALEPRWPDSGVVEGFYGIPWSDRERRRMIRRLSALGLKTYVYAPKLDPLHRERWREPYPAAELARFAALAAAADAAGVRFVFGVSPFIDFDGAPADREALLAKLRAVVQAGARGVVLLADDIESALERPIDGALGELHAAAVNEVLAALRAEAPELAAWFVPTVYTDERLSRWSEAPAYLQALRALDPAVGVVWVGPEVFNAALAAADLAPATEALGRAPVLWDNFWANDGGDGLLGRLLLAPYSAHAADLRAACAGIWQNPLIQGALARLDLGLFAAWVEEPGISPEAARARAAAAEVAALQPGDWPPDDWHAARLEEVLRAFEANGMGTPGDRALEAAVADLDAALAGPPAGLIAPASALLPRLAGLAVLGSELHHSRLDPDLVDDLFFPLERLRTEGETGLWALGLLAERLAGRAGTRESALAAEAHEAALECRFAFSPGVIDGLRGRIAALPAADTDLRGPQIGDEPPRCRVGRECRWRPFAGATGSLGVRGLPGARLEGDEVIWLPRHGGVYRIAAWAVGASGFGMRLATVATGDALD